MKSLEDKFWTIEKIRESFERYNKEYGKFPTAPDIDNCEYLPSSRHIQRKFGGLMKVRKILGHEITDYGSGDYRTDIAVNSGKQGLLSESELEDLLITRFGEIYVHSEKRYGNGRNRVDFYVYSPDGNFGIDAFYTKTSRDLQKNINIKVDKYIDYPKENSLYFVVSNPDFKQKQVDQICSNMKKIALISHLKVVSVEGLLEDIKDKTRYTDPIGFVSN